MSAQSTGYRRLNVNDARQFRTGMGDITQQYNNATATLDKMSALDLLTPQRCSNGYAYFWQQLLYAQSRLDDLFRQR